jgi:hypothetical protein
VALVCREPARRWLRFKPRRFEIRHAEKGNARSAGPEPRSRSSQSTARPRSIASVSRTRDRIRRVSSAFNLDLIQSKAPANPKPPAEPETPGFAQLLRHRPTLNWKRTLSFLSIRKWPSKNREAIIAAFKDCKTRDDQPVARFAALEMARIVRPWLASSASFTVTAPPAGVRRQTSHFASVIGEEMARLLCLDFAETFLPRTHRGSSFPKKDDKRGKMKLLRPLTGCWILVDDVSTSASTLEAATHALIAGGAQFVLPIVWIYGSVQKDLIPDSEPEAKSVLDGVLSSAPTVGSDPGM